MVNALGRVARPMMRNGGVSKAGLTLQRVLTPEVIAQSALSTVFSTALTYAMNVPHVDRLPDDFSTMIRRGIRA